jgi:hypothetical protein
VTAGATAATSQGDLSVEITQACLLVRFQGPRKWGRRNRSRVVQRLPFNQSQYRPRNPHSCLGLWQTQASTFKDSTLKRHQRESHQLKAEEGESRGDPYLQ